MPGEPNRHVAEPHVKRVAAAFRSYARIAACLSILLGCLVLAGWLADIPLLKSVKPSWAAMHPITALCYIIAGSALLIVQDPYPSRKGRIAAGILSTFVVAFSIISLLDFSVLPGHPEGGAEAAKLDASSGLLRLGIMSPITAIAFASIGIGILSICFEQRRRNDPVDYDPTQLAVLMATLFTLPVLIGYLFSSDTVRMVAPYSMISIHSALITVVLSGAVLCARPERGIMRVFVADTVGGEVARRMLPLAFMVPIGLLVLCYLGYAYHLYDSRFGLSLFTSFNIGAITLIVIRTATSLTHSDLRRRRVESALTASERRFRALIENSSDAISLFSRNGTLLYGSPVITRILGYELDEVRGRNPLGIIHPEDRKLVADALAQSITQPGTDIEVGARVRHKDGSWRDLEGVITNLLNDPSVHAIVANYRDVTEHRRLEEALRESHKMESIGRLAGGVAHDFNNILTAILGHAELASDQLPPDSPAQEDIQQVQESANRAAALTSQLLAFARKQIIEPRVVDLNELIIKLSSMLRRLIGENIDLVVKAAPDLHHTKVDPSQFEQILINLAVNGRDAMPDGGRLIIETSNEYLDEEYAEQHNDVQTGQYVLVTVSDTGQGIEEGIRLHIFEPFFTTKEKGQGTGLGLATCYGIVKQAGGHIWLYSEPGIGTTFKIYLPRAEAPLEKPLEAPAVSRQVRGTETVLLVEDEPTLLDIATKTLRENGYCVISAPSGEAALNAATLHDGSIDLVVTDVIMPGMNGGALAERLKLFYPDIRIIFASGYTEDTIVHQGVLEPGISYLRKPFTPSTLAVRVRDALDESVPS